MSKGKRETAKANNPLADAHSQIYQDDSDVKPTTSASFINLMKQKAIQQQASQGNALISIQSGMIEIRGCQMTATGLIIPESTTGEDLEFVARIINQLEGALQWMIGDIVAFSEQIGYGDVATLAAWFNKSPQTLSNWGSICRFYSESSRQRELSPKRRDSLSFTHHAEVAGREDAESLLEQAEKEGWSVARLRQETQDAPNPSKPNRIDKWWHKVSNLGSRAANYNKSERRELAKRLRQLAEELETV